MKQATIIVGQVFGRLTVSGPRVLRGGEGHYPCVCACGNDVLVRGVSLTRGLTASCGCLARQRSAERTYKHGLCASPEYTAFNNMHRRCYEEGNNRYPRYGARGIRVAPEWHSFEKFYADMGPRPVGHTLERIDRNANYSAANCKWATQEEQQNNRSNNRLITYEGTTQTLAQWARELGMNQKTLISRITLRKWSVDRAFTQPIRVRP